MIQPFPAPGAAPVRAPACARRPALGLALATLALAALALAACEPQPRPSPRSGQGSSPSPETAAVGCTAEEMRTRQARTRACETQFRDLLRQAEADRQRGSAISAAPPAAPRDRF